MQDVTDTEFVVTGRNCMGEMSGSHHASLVSRSLLLNRMLLAIEDKGCLCPSG